MTKLFALIYLLFMFSCSHSSSNKQRCLNDNTGKTCYDIGSEFFLHVDSVKGMNEVENIKKLTAEYFEQGCKYGHAISCFEFGKFNLYIGEKNIGKELIKKACEQKYDKACT